MGLSAATDIRVGIVTELEGGYGEQIVGPTIVRLPLLDVTANFDAAEYAVNENRIGGGDEFPTESRVKRWKPEMKLRMEANVEAFDFFLSRAMGVKAHADQGTPVTHRKSTPTFIDVVGGGNRNAKSFNMAYEDGNRSVSVVGCAVARIALDVPTDDRIIMEVDLRAADIKTPIGVSMPAAEQPVHYVYANDAVFTALGAQGDLVATKRLRSFRWELSQDIPENLQYFIGGGFRTVGNVLSGAVPKKAIFENRRITSQFVVLYDTTQEADALQAGTSGQLTATFKGEAIPSASPAAQYQISLVGPKTRYRTADQQREGSIITVGVAQQWLKKTEAGGDQNKIFVPEILTVKTADFDFD